MAVANYKDEIIKSNQLLKDCIKDKSGAFLKEKEVLELVKTRYKMLYSQIHEYLAPKKNDYAEDEILEHIKSIWSLDILACESKISRFKRAISDYERKGNDDGVELCYRYLQEWLILYESFQNLIAFRDLTTFCNIMEYDKKDKDKVWKYSIDPYNDGGYTGVNKGFFYYFNQMVLKRNIKFISKQQSTGTGKCVIPSTKVLTPNGTKTISELEVGDFVCSMKDNIVCNKKITGKWNTKKKQIKITTRGGASITVSPEHRLYTQKGYIKAQDIAQSDYLYRLCKEIQPQIEYKISEEELIFITCMLFDGHCKIPNYSFTKMPDTKIMEAFLNSLTKLKINYTLYSKSGTDCKTCRVHQNEKIANNFLYKYQLDGKLSKEKRLPKQFFDMSVENKFKFIGLMFATDGYIVKEKGCGIALSSQGLVEDIRYLLDTCGIYSHISHKYIKQDGKMFEAWVLNIPNEYMEKVYKYCYCYDKEPALENFYKNNFLRDRKPYSNNTGYPKELFENRKDFRRLTRKQWARNKTFKRSYVEEFNENTHTLDDIVYKDFVWEQIKSIEFIDEETEMIDIEVEDTHNFIANNIVSHNSHSNHYAIAWLLGIDPDNDILIVLGNPALVLTNIRTIVELMKKPRFCKIFPQYEKYLEITEDKKGNKVETVSDNIFSVCRAKEGELTLADSNKPVNIKVISKDTPIDGIRVRFLFLDDVCRSKDAGNMKQHETDISNFWNSWWKRNYNTEDFYIILGCTAYSIFDIASQLISYFSKGKMIRSAVNKYSYLSLDNKCVFIKVPKIDEELNRSTYPQKFSYEEAIKIKERDYRSFMAMEQQQPMPPENSPFYVENLNGYDVIPEEDRSDFCWASLDTARVGYDYNSMPIFVKVGDKFYLKDCLYLNEPMEKVYGKIVEKIIQHKITKLVIEKNIDTSLKSLLDKMLAEQGINYCEIIEVYATIKKEEKIYNMENTIKNNIVFPNMHLYSYSSQMGKFMNDVFSFSYTHKNEHDDSIDSIATFCQRMIVMPTAKTKARLLHI